MRKVATLAGVLALLAGVAVAVVPFLTRHRPYPATVPQPTPLFTTPLVTIKPGERACMTDAVLDEKSEVAQFRVATTGKPGPPLELLITGAGYHASARVRGGYPDNTLLSVPVRAPSRPVRTTICLRDAGRSPANLYAADDRTHTRSATFVQGHRVGPNPDVAFYERRPRSILERLPLTLRRISAFRPVGRGVLWPLTVLFLLGVPAGVLWALARSLDEDAEAET